MFYQLSLALILCFFSIASFGQVRVSVSGKVTGPDGKGLPYISVLISNTSFGGITDGAGNYSFTADLRPGNYTLEFSGVGFKTKEQSLQVGSATTYTSFCLA